MAGFDGIQAKGLFKEFGSLKTPVIQGIDLSVSHGEFVSLTGRSGSGKSTLLYLLSGLDDPTNGNVFIDDRNIHGLDSKSLHRFRNLELGFVFQFHYLLPELTGLENVLMPALKTNAGQIKEKRAHELLSIFEISHVAGKRPGQMSGGEQQRVSIARALIMEPRYLFADEPTGNLDSVNGRIVMDIFRRINKEQQTTILMVTHDPEYAAMAQRQIVLVDGKVDKEL